MLINLRNALMGGKRLPYDAEVEYLESSGTQYINTGIKPGPNTRVEITFAMTTFTANCGLFGARGTAAANNNSYNLFIINNNGSRVRWDWSGTGNYQTSQAETSTAATYVLGSAGGNITRDGVTVMAVSASKAAINYPLYIFNFNNVGSTFSTGANARFWSVKIYDGQTLVFDAIPVRKGNVGYLYDRVSGKLFGNAGTGDFVLGPDVVPVEYIESESNHAQVIDTGFYANQNTKALITFEKLGADGWLFGSRNGSSSATDKFGIFAYQSPDGKISAQVGNVYIEPIISGGLTNRKRTIELSLSDGVIVDGETIATFTESQKSQTFTSTYPMSLFNMRISSSGFNAGIYCRVYTYQIFENGVLVRSFRPVRVGTEGAMMDVLTRRIYRNAGTGAFGYGNDLKYPIPAE